MATMTTSDIQELYNNIVAGIEPYYQDNILLPSEMFIATQYNIENSAGNTIDIPRVNAWSAASSVSEGASILTANEDNFNPTSATLSMVKRGKGTDVSQEAIEDGGAATIQNQVITRLSQGLAQATDEAGFAAMASAFTNYGGTGVYNAYEANIVLSPEAMAYGSKRQPVVKAWFDPDKDTHQFRATVRNGFANIRANFGAKVLGNSVVDDTTADTTITLSHFAKAVAALRAANAPTMANGYYAAFVGPTTELAIASQLNQVAESVIPSLSDEGNEVLRNGAVGVAVGCMFFRTNNLASEAIA